jgi:hypothetical protein
MRYVLDIPVKTVSEANKSNEHWTVKSKRHNLQHRYVKLFYRKLSVLPKLPCHLILIRISPRKLDDDNLLASLKYIRDAIADCIIPYFPKGFADSSPLLTWSYSQEKGKPKEYAIRIIIEEKSN